MLYILMTTFLALTSLFDYFRLSRIILNLGEGDSDSDSESDLDSITEVDEISLQLETSFQETSFQEPADDEYVNCLVKK